MALKVLENGYVEIRSEKDAKAALKRFRNLKAEIDRLREESGLDDLEQDAVAYKAGLQNYMVKNKLKQINGKGFHGTLVEGFEKPRWIGTDEDLTGDEPKGTIPLKTLIERKFKSKITQKGSKARKVWMTCTKRVVDPEALDELVNEKVLTTKDVKPALVEIPRNPYLRVFDEN